MLSDIYDLSAFKISPIKGGISFSSKRAYKPRTLIFQAGQMVFDLLNGPIDERGLAHTAISETVNSIPVVNKILSPCA